MRTIIEGGTIVNEGKSMRGSIVIDDEAISAIVSNEDTPADADRRIDATGCYVLPGIIDDHVHMREPGMTEKADMDSETRAAAAGGVTSVFDMPNTNPQTTTLEALAQKQQTAAAKSHVNYAFFFGATNDNADLFSSLDIHSVPGIKLFMGSSTGNMLVDSKEALERIFASAPLPIMAHCEDTAIINQNMAHFKQEFATDDPDIRFHSLIRSEEACLSSTRKAIELAVMHKKQLHLAHISTAEELKLIPADCLHTITAEATVGHLVFSMVDYERLGSRIKVNPSIKSVIDQEELRKGLMDGRISVVATDHAPHLLQQKQGGCAKAASGMPMLQFSLPTMLELVDEGVLTIERMVQLMCHNPATIFSVRQRGFLRPGYKADITIVKPHSPWTVTKDIIESKCKWSPMEGHEYQWRVEATLCNGHIIYNKGIVDADYTGQQILFR